MKRTLRLILLGMLVLPHACWDIQPAAADDQLDTDMEYLQSLSLAELMDVEIYSASRQDEKLFETSAAVYVITQEDIRRSGLSNIPELLRMVPGFTVAQLDSNIWAISSRGFKQRHADKLLVMIDGRSVYTPLFGGVYWDAQDYLLSDIDHIEVIRGPGATLWGANAVNGVVNIITKNAQDTQNGLVEARSGSQQNYNLGVRYGATSNNNIFWRLYGKGDKWRENEDKEGNDAFDDGDKASIGFRLDWLKDSRNSLNIHGDYYDGKISSNKWQEDEDTSGGNIMFSWDHEISHDSSLNLQGYFDRTERHSSILGEDRNTLNFDLQHNFNILQSNDIVWGAGYRYINDQTDPDARTTINPASKSDQLYSAYIQDKITIIDQYLWFTVGSKIEHNDYTGFEYQPSIRILALPSEHHTLWGSISRAVKTPARIDHDFDIDMGTAGPYQMVALGNEDVVSEELLSYELGYRFKTQKNFSLDLTGYYNDYDKLLSKKTILDPAKERLIFTFDNSRSGKVYGGEILANWQITAAWKVSASYSYLKMDMTLAPDDTDDVEEIEGTEPTHQTQLRSYWNISDKWQFDLMTYYFDELYEGDVEDCLRLDLRLGWHPLKTLEISLGVQNALDASHAEEIGSRHVFVSEIKRNVWGKVTWRF